MANLAVDGYPVIIFEWLLFALTTLLVLIRLFVQYRFSASGWLPKREAFVIAAWVLYLYYTISDSVLNGYDFFNQDVPLEETPNAALIWVFISDLLYICIFYACKAALLCLYRDITPRHVFPKTWFVIVSCWVLIGVGVVFQFLQKFIPCRPLHHNWNVSYYDECHSKRRPWQDTAWSLHLLTDILVFVIPFSVLRSLPSTSISKERKRGAYAIFGLGFLNIASAILLLVYYILPDNASLGVIENFYYAEEFLGPFQIGSAVIIICLPYVRRLWKGTKQTEARTETAGRTTGPTAYSSASKDPEIGAEVHDHDKHLGIKVEGHEY